MDIQNFTRMMHQKGAQQVIIAPNVPMRILAGGKWQQTTLFTPSEHVINTMLQNCVPPNFQGSWRQENEKISFPYATATGRYGVEVQNIHGSCTVTITDQNAPPTADTPAPPIAPSAAPVTTGISSSSSSLSPPPLKATSQIAREMGKGGVNIFAPSAPDAPRTPAAPTPDITAPPAHAAPPPMDSIMWYHAAGGRQVGPITQLSMDQCIAFGVVGPDTMVWHEGMSDWAMAKLTELEPLFKSQPPPIESDPAINYGIYGTNSSGRGWDAPVPHAITGETNKFNWGAFSLAPFWCFAHGVWYLGVAYLVLGMLLNWVGGGGAGLLMLFPAALLGMFGDAIAWKNRQFDSVEQFRAVQQSWMQWGLLLTVLGFFIGFIIAASLY